MRSIRRSLLGYLFLLIMVALGAVGVLVDRFAVGAIRSREQSETGRIEREFEYRKHDATTKFDTELLAETKALAKEVQYKTAALLGQNAEQRGRGPQRPPQEPSVRGPEEEPRVSRLRATLWELAPVPFVLPTVAAARVARDGRRPGAGPRAPEPPVRAPEEEGRTYAARVAVLGLSALPFQLPALATMGTVEQRGDWSDWRRYNPYPGWVEYDAPRAFARIQEAMKNTFGEDDHSGIFQITLVASYPGHPNHNVAVVRSNRLGSDLPFDPAWSELNADTEPKFDDPPGPDKLRRVVTATHSGRPIVFGVSLAAPPPATVPLRFGPQRSDLVIRIFVHHLRPYSELDSRLAAAREECAQQVDSVRTETQMELAQFRSRLSLIGSGTFAALVLGGWVLVARGLSPLRKLSDAVSRVSEKDFRLPIEVAELGRELAPIHARLTQTLILLQRAFEREKQAVADISHELRTPIAALLATIDVALRKPRTPDQYRTTLEECRLISKQLGQLVERIMTLASLDAGNDHSSVARTNVADLVGGCAAVIRPLAAASNVTVSVQAGDDLALETDAAKLREVLMNLLHNAIEYNKPGGSIEVTARADAAAVVFEVRDTGIGIPADIQERIFERFYRADASRHATGVHAGLGLAIVKEYVSRLNGTIGVESEPGVGTTFRVRLPAANDLPPAPASAHIRAKSLRDDAIPTGS